MAARLRVQGFVVRGSWRDMDERPPTLACLWALKGRAGNAVSAILPGLTKVRTAVVAQSALQ